MVYDNNDINLNNTVSVNCSQISDGEDSQLFAGLTVAVNYTVGAPVIESDTSTSCITCSTQGQIIIGAIVIEGIIIFALTIHFCKHICCTGSRSDRYGTCRWKIRRI